MPSALVLAGGGVAGIAWELGVLRGILDVRPDLEEFLLGTDVLIGTSAGSTVAAMLGGGTPLDELYDAQLDPDSAEIPVDVDLPALVESFGAATAGVTDPTELRRRIGALALATDTVPESARRGAVAARLPVPEWSERDVRIPAVDAETGEVVVFTSDSGVALVDAVTASCAVPGVWPPATVDGRRYVDGGVRSSTNADLAAGCDRVLIVLPNLPDTPVPFTDLADEIAALAPAQVVTVYADDASIVAFGTNPLAASTRGPSARAGREVGRRCADEVAALFV
ncbi:patatin-like phospholipase family protein [Jatrophihabitans sp. YIM 134969]